MGNLLRTASYRPTKQAHEWSAAATARERGKRGKRTLVRDEHGEVLHRLRVVRDEVPALQHRLVVGEETVELHERRNRHDEERVVRLRRHEAG